MTQPIEVQQEKRLRYIERVLAMPPAYLIHNWRAGRALQRRKGLSPRMRAMLEWEMPIWEAAAKREGVLLRGWRKYPDRSGALAFRSDVGGDTPVLTPPKRQRKPDLPPAPADGGTLLAQLEASLELVKTKRQT